MLLYHGIPRWRLFHEPEKDPYSPDALFIGLFNILPIFVTDFFQVF